MEQLRIPYDWDSLERRWVPSATPLDFAGCWPAGFDYGRTPRAFGGRRGRGPLVVAWDTNVLIDYLTHGRVMWDEDGPPEVEGEYGEELVALKALVTVAFPFREVAIWVTETQVADARRALSPARIREREAAIEKLLAALSLTVPSDQRQERSVTSERIATAWLAELITDLPEGHDQLLVGEAVAAGCHVFLTRDNGILRQRGRLAPYIALLRPTDLLDELALSGELQLPTSSVMPEALVPDLQRLTHLITPISDR